MKTILVVEDDQALQDAVCMKLKKEGINCLTAKSSEEAIKVLKSSEVIDALWLDHYLIGDLNGIEIVRQLRQIKSRQDLPVYVVSNTVSPEKVEDYFNLQAKKYYVKSDYRLEEIVEDIKLGWQQ